MDDTLNNNNDPVFGLGGKFNTSLGALDLGIGLGYQTANNNDVIGLSVDTTFANGLRAILNYWTLDAAAVGGDLDHFALGVGYSAGAITVGYNYGVFAPEVGADTTGWGLAANYDLGGGAVVQFGYGTDDTAGDPNQFSLVVAMSF